MKTLYKLIIATFVISFSLQASAVTVRVSVPSYHESTKTVLEQAARDYESSNPGTTINVEVGSWSAWQQKLQTDFFSGNNADLIFSTRSWVPTYAAENKLADFDDYLTDSDRALFVPSLLNGAKVNGKQYALPSVTSARNLYVNIDLLRKIGASVPKTWNDVMNIAQKVGELDGIYGFGIQGKEVEMEKYFYYVLWNFGGSVMNETINGDKSALDSKDAIAAAQFYADLIKTGGAQDNVVGYNREDLVELFKQGKLAMMITHGVMGGEIIDGNLPVNYVQTDVPGMENTKRGTTLGVIDAVHLSANSKVKEEAVKFLMHTYKSKYHASWVGQAGLLPVTKDAGVAPIFQKSNLQAMISAVPNARFAFIHPQSTKIIDILKVELQNLYSGKKSADNAMKDAASRINRAAR